MKNSIALIAQGIERDSSKVCVGGSIPSKGAKLQRKYEDYH